VALNYSKGCTKYFYGPSAYDYLGLKLLWTLELLVIFKYTWEYKCFVLFHFVDWHWYNNKRS